MLGKKVELECTKIKKEDYYNNNEIAAQTGRIYVNFIGNP